MAALGSNILIAGNPHPESFSVGADFVPDIATALEQCQERFYDLIVLPLQADISSEMIQQFIDSQQEDCQWILTHGDQQAKRLTDWTSRTQIAHLHQGMNAESLEPLLLKCLEDLGQRRQDHQLTELVKEQNSKLKKLYAELEDRVQSRSQYLEESLSRLQNTKSKAECLRQALIAVHSSESVSQMETKLNQALSDYFELEWTRIFFAPQDESFATQKALTSTFQTLRCPLFKDQTRLGSLFFLAKIYTRFSKNDKQFLMRVAETVSLAIDRLSKLQESESLKQQWEVTFNSIDTPVMIINEKFAVQQANRAFKEKTGLDHATQQGKCYELLFNRQNPCQGCHLGKNFRIEDTSKEGDLKVWEVNSSLLQDKRLGEARHYVHLYVDKTSEVQAESRLIESAKYAELGVIGSSIAHELNNPLGGILTFVQMIKNDLDTDHPIKEDILEMEKGAFRCRDIIRDLLGFVRISSSNSQLPKYDVRDILVQTLKVVELKIRARGLRAKLNLTDKETSVGVDPDVLGACIQSVLQEATDHASYGLDLGLSPDQLVLNIDLIRERSGSYLLQVCYSFFPQTPSMEETRRTMIFAQQTLQDLGLQMTTQVQNEEIKIVQILLPNLEPAT